MQSPEQLCLVAGTRLHVRDTGPRDAPAVILLHGFAANLWTWDGWAEGLDDSFRVIRLDLPGSGLSPPDASGDCRDERTVELLAALMQAPDVPVASFVGQSFRAWWHPVYPG